MPATKTKSNVERAQELVRDGARDGIERRYAAVDRVEVRAKRDDGSYDFEGHAAVFDELSDDLGDPIFGSFHELIKRGAFKPVLGDDVRFLVNHNPDLLLARTESGTLSLKEDPRGLLATANVAPTSYGEDMRVLLDRGDLSQMSFAFRVGEDEWFEDKDGNVTRTILKFDELFDVSVVTYPAYPQTDAGVRALHKLERGETVTREERAAIEAMLAESSTEQSTEEPEDRAAGQEPVAEASEDEGQADVEDTEPEGGISSRSARVRLRAIQARI